MVAMESTIITCPNCGFSKGVPTDKLPQNTAEISCPKCKQGFSYTPIHKVQDFTIESMQQGNADDTPPDTQNCPFCNGNIKFGAIKCKLCGAMLNESQTPPISAAATKTCPFCQKPILEGALKCKHCKSNLDQVSSQQVTHFGYPNDTPTLNCIQAVKSTNTPCLWVSLDYWNLYLLEDKILAVRCYRGIRGVIGFIIGLFLAFVGFIILGGVGILLDKSSGEGKCRIYADKINEILSNRSSYTIIEATWDSVSSIDSSDLCLGNLWLKYMIRIGGRKYYFENDKYDQIINAISSHRH